MWYAGSGNHTAIAKLLLNIPNINPGTEDNCGQTPLYQASINGSGELIEIFLIGRNKKVKITKEVVKAAARNRQSGGEVMKVLLQERGSEVKITEEMVKAAGGNEKSGEEG